MDAKTWRALIAGLAPAQRALVDELMTMLERLDAPQLIAEDVAVERFSGLLRITLPHHTQTDYSIRLEASPRGCVVRFGNGVREIYAFEGFVDGTPWSTLVVGFVETVMRGTREVHTTFVGRHIARVEVYEVDRTGRMTLESDDHFPRRARQWRPFARALTEVRRVSYMTPLEHA